MRSQEYRKYYAPRFCMDCGCSVSPNAIRCRSCYDESRRAGKCKDCGQQIATMAVRCEVCSSERRRQNQASQKDRACPDCGRAIQKKSTRCIDCYNKRRQESRQQYRCARCNGPRSRTAFGNHCMPCSKIVQHEEFLEECRYTREEYEFYRTGGATHAETIEWLVKHLGRSLTEVKRRLELAADSEMMAA